MVLNRHQWAGGSDNSVSQDFTLRCSGHLIAILTQMSIL